jgi:hypothetical protein
MIDTVTGTDSGPIADIEPCSMVDRGLGVGDMERGAGVVSFEIA